MFSRYGMSGMFGPPQGGGMGAGRMSQPFPSRYMPPRQMPPTGGSGYFSPPMQPRMMDTRGMLPPTDTFNAPPPMYSGPTGGNGGLRMGDPSMNSSPQGDLTNFTNMRAGVSGIQPGDMGGGDMAGRMSQFQGLQGPGGSFSSTLGQTGGGDYAKPLPMPTLGAPPGYPPMGGPDTFNAPPPTMSAPQYPGGMASYMNRFIGGFDPSKFR
jgi:hypothetical protein